MRKQTRSDAQVNGPGPIPQKPRYRAVTGL